MSVAITSAPSPANSSALERPIPCAAAVITALLPASLPAMVPAPWLRGAAPRGFRYVGVA